MERKQLLEKMHNEARYNLVKDLQGFVKQSGDGGEYYICVNDMKMWLSQQEVMRLLGVLETYAYWGKMEYKDTAITGMAID